MTVTLQRIIHFIRCRFIAITASYSFQKLHGVILNFCLLHSPEITSRITNFGLMTTTTRIQLECSRPVTRPSPATRTHMHINSTYCTINNNSQSLQEAERERIVNRELGCRGTWGGGVPPVCLPPSIVCGSTGRHVAGPGSPSAPWSNWPGPSRLHVDPSS